MASSSPLFIGLPAALARIDRAVDPTSSLPNDQYIFGGDEPGLPVVSRAAVAELWKLLTAHTHELRLELDDYDRVPVRTEWVTPPSTERGDQGYSVTKGLYVDLCDGALGSGWKLLCKDRDQGEIVLPESLLERLLLRLPEATPHAPRLSKASSPSSREIIAEIVRRFDGGETRNKSEWHALLAPDMKPEAWRSLWKDAATQRPDLSKPGPKEDRGRTR